MFGWLLISQMVRFTALVMAWLCDGECVGYDSYSGDLDAEAEIF